MGVRGCTEGGAVQILEPLRSRSCGELVRRQCKGRGVLRNAGRPNRFGRPATIPGLEGREGLCGTGVGSLRRSCERCVGLLDQYFERRTRAPRGVQLIRFTVRMNKRYE